MGISSNNEDEQIRSSHLSVSSKSRTQHHHVEIATLTLPAAATTSGVESGDGSTFVLEAPSRVIEQLVENEQQQHTSQPSYGASEISHANTRHPHIEGVVDLEMVSHLVTGVTEEEFVGFLHQDVAHTHVQRHETVELQQHDTKEEDSESLSLENLRKPSKEGENETQCLLHQSIKEDTACVVVPSDPFVNIIAEFHQESAVEYDATPSTSVQAEENDAISVSREAYLLSIPTTKDAGSEHGADSYYSADGMDGSLKAVGNIFVLALPEVMETIKDDGELDNIAGSTRTSVVTTNTFVHNKVEDIQHRLEHAFAHLPTDVQHIELRVSTAFAIEGSALHKLEEELHLDLVVDRKVPAIGYIILVSGLFALSSIGVAFDLQQGGVTPEMKAFWRFSCTALLFLILSAKSLNKEELGKFSPLEFWVWMPFAGVMYSFMCTAFVVGLEMTSLVNAFILSNLASLIIIGSKVVMGRPVLFFEGIGAAIGMSGAIFCAYAGNDSNEADNVGSANLAMTGNVLCFLASVATALYLSVAKSLRPRVDLFVFMLFIFSYASISLLFYMIWIGQPYQCSFDPVIGLFGWMDLQFDRLLLELWMAIVCNGIGTCGYIAIMKYFDPVVVSMVMLMEPILASLMGAAAGVSALPGLLTWVGDAIVVVGSVLVISSGSKKTETIDATKALHTVNEELAVEGKTDLLRRSSMSTKTPALKKSISLKSPMVLRSPRKQKGTRHERTISEETNMEFIFVGNKSRDATAVSALGDSRHKVTWN